MNVYRGEFARLYDLFYSEKPYDAEVEFVDRLLRAYADGPSERLLDVACGTGQHAVRFADRGWDVVGVDASEDMLERARERGRGKRVEFLAADMRALDLPSAAFDAATCLFDSIGYAATNDGVISTLSGIRRHLRPSGLLVVEFWHASAMLRKFEPVRVREWDTPDGLILRTSKTALDVEAQVARVDYSVHRLGADGRYASWTEAHANRYFLVQEMALLLGSAGLDLVRFTAGFDEKAAIDASTWHVLAVARAGARRSP